MPSAARTYITHLPLADGVATTRWPDPHRPPTYNLDIRASNTQAPPGSLLSAGVLDQNEFHIEAPDENDSDCMVLTMRHAGAIPPGNMMPGSTALIAALRREPPNERGEVVHSFRHVLPNQRIDRVVALVIEEIQRINEHRYPPLAIIYAQTAHADIRRIINSIEANAIPLWSMEDESEAEEDEIFHVRMIRPGPGGYRETTRGDFVSLDGVYAHDTVHFRDLREALRVASGRTREDRMVWTRALPNSLQSAELGRSNVIQDDEVIAHNSFVFASDSLGEDGSSGSSSSSSSGEEVSGDSSSSGEEVSGDSSSSGEGSSGDSSSGSSSGEEASGDSSSSSEGSSGDSSSSDEEEFEQYTLHVFKVSAIETDAGGITFQYRPSDAMPDVVELPIENIYDDFSCSDLWENRRSPVNEEVAATWTRYAEYAADLKVSKRAGRNNLMHAYYNIYCTRCETRRGPRTVLYSIARSRVLTDPKDDADDFPTANVFVIFDPWNLAADGLAFFCPQDKAACHMIKERSIEKSSYLWIKQSDLQSIPSGVGACQYYSYRDFPSQELDRLMDDLDDLERGLSKKIIELHNARRRLEEAENDVRMREDAREARNASSPTYTPSSPDYTTPAMRERVSAAETALALAWQGVEAAKQRMEEMWGPELGRARARWSESLREAMAEASDGSSSSSSEEASGSSSSSSGEGSSSEEDEDEDEDEDEELFCVNMVRPRPGGYPATRVEFVFLDGAYAHGSSVPFRELREALHAASGLPLDTAWTHAPPTASAYTLESWGDRNVIADDYIIAHDSCVYAPDSRGAGGSSGSSSSPFVDEYYIVRVPMTGTWEDVESSDSDSSSSSGGEVSSVFYLRPSVSAGSDGRSALTYSKFPERVTTFNGSTTVFDVSVERMDGGEEFRIFRRHGADQDESPLISVSNLSESTVVWAYPTDCLWSDEPPVVMRARRPPYEANCVVVMDPFDPSDTLRSGKAIMVIRVQDAPPILDTLDMQLEVSGYNRSFRGIPVSAPPTPVPAPAPTPPTRQSMAERPRSGGVERVRSRSPDARPRPVSHTPAVEARRTAVSASIAGNMCGVCRNVFGEGDLDVDDFHAFACPHYVCRGCVAELRLRGLLDRCPMCRTEITSEWEAAQAALRALRLARPAQ